MQETYNKAILSKTESTFSNVSSASYIPEQMVLLVHCRCFLNSLSMLDQEEAATCVTVAAPTKCTQTVTKLRQLEFITE